LQFFTPPSGRGLVIPVFFFFNIFFWVVTCPRPPVFPRPNKYSLCVSFATQARACILSDRNIFYTPRGGRTTAASNAPGAFLVFFRVLLPLFSWSLAPDLQFLLSQTTIRRKLPLYSLDSYLSDHNIFCTLRGGRTMAGYNDPGAFLV